MCKIFRINYYNCIYIVIIGNYNVKPVPKSFYDFLPSTNTCLTYEDLIRIQKDERYIASMYNAELARKRPPTMGHNDKNGVKLV